MQGRARIDFVNTLRGFAALLVVLSHYLDLFWLRRATASEFANAPLLPVESYATPAYVLRSQLFPALDLGAYGVGLFFLISGFVLPLSLQKMNGLGFLANRLVRIVPTYMAGFSITLLAVYVSSRYFGRIWPYHLQDVLIHYLPGLRDLMWSKVIDGIVWTLEIEIKFYLLCAAIIVWFRKQSLMVFIAPIALFMLAMLCNHQLPGLEAHARAYQLALVFIFCAQYIAYMFIGVVFHYLYCGKLGLRKACLMMVGFFGIFCLHWAMGPDSNRLAGAWNYGFALLTFAFAYSFPQLFKANRVFDFLADISYPLYVVHSVVGYVALLILLDRGFSIGVALIIVIAGALGLASVLHVLVEYPSQRLSKRIGKRLTQDAAQKADDLSVVAACSA